MINFRASQFMAALAGVALMGTVAFATPAAEVRPRILQAQTEAPAPRRLLPRRPVTPESPPPQNAPSGGDRLPESRTGIEVNPLRGLDPQEFGVLNAATDGFTRDMWAGTSAALVAHLFDQLPGAIASPSIRDLLRRALLTAAMPPEPEAPTVNLAARRVSQLQSMGLLGSASSLLAVAPRRESDAALRLLHVENLLIRNEVVSACAETRRPGNDLAKAAWQQLLIFCHAAEKNFSEASLGAGLLSESADPVDPLFLLLIDSLVSDEVPVVETVDRPTPLLLAMLAHAKVPFPAGSLEAVPPALLAMIAASPETDLDVRLAAAERAVRYGAMTTDRLSKLYAGAPFSGEDLDSALSTAQAARSPRGRALLFQAASGQNVPTARAEVLQRALDFAMEDGLYPLSIRLYRAMLETMTPSVELSWFAADAVRALSALGRADLARPWMNGLRYQSVRDPAAKQALQSLWAIATLAATPETAGGVIGSLEEWRGAVSAEPPQPAHSRIKAAMALLEFRGHAIEAAQWRTALATFESGTAQLPDYAYRLALDRASAAGRLGETILLVAVIAGGTETLDLGVLQGVVTALRAVGLEKPAQALILEAAVGRRI